MVPLYAFVEGDTLGILVLVQSTDSIAHLAAVIQDSASMRVAPSTEAHVIANEQVLDPAATVASCRLGPLDRVDLVTSPDARARLRGRR